MPVPQLTDLDLGNPRGVSEILATALALYRRLPLMFIFLAAIAVVPYEVVVLLLAHGHGGLGQGTVLVLALAELALVQPCVATLQIQLLLGLRDGHVLDTRSIIVRGVRILPSVAAAEIVAAIGIGIGVLLFVIPGVLLAIRLVVVSQTAAVEHTNWPTTLRRSLRLTHGNAWRSCGLLVIVGLLNEIPASVLGAGSSLTAGIIGLLIALVTQSFGTLVIDLLYFDLHARETTALA